MCLSTVEPMRTLQNPIRNSEYKPKANTTAKSPEDWARIWFAKLSKFHQIRDPQVWCFAEDDVIAFLRAKLKAGVPAWKRLKIVQGLIVYQLSYPPFPLRATEV